MIVSIFFINPYQLEASLESTVAPTTSQDTAAENKAWASTETLPSFQDSALRKKRQSKTQKRTREWCGKGALLRGSPRSWRNENPSLEWIIQPARCESVCYEYERRTNWSRRERECVTQRLQSA